MLRSEEASSRTLPHQPVIHQYFALHGNPRVSSHETKRIHSTGERVDLFRIRPFRFYPSRVVARNYGTAAISQTRQIIGKQPGKER